MSVPKLRFKEFDGDWIKSKLGSEAQFFQGEQVSLDDQCSEYAHGLIKFLRIENFTQKSKDFRYIRYTGSQEKILVEQDIAIVRYGATAGFICSGETGVIANNLFKVSVDNKKINQKYLELVLKSEKTFNYFQAEMSGGAMPALNFKIVGNLDITYSSIPEQTKIASFLSNVDEKISQLTQKHELLSQYKQGMMQKLFSQQIRFKADDGSEFGEWEGKELHQIFQIKAGGDIEKSSVSEVRTSEFSYPIFANSDKNKGFYGWANKFKYKEAVTVTGRGNLGIAVARNEPFYPIVRLLVLLPLVKQNLKFFEEQINLLDIVSESTGVPQLTAPQLSKYKVNVPSLEEQTKIANFLSSIDQKIEVVAQQIEQAKQWKKGLLQQMFI